MVKTGICVHLSTALIFRILSNYTYNNQRYKKYQCLRSHRFGEFVEYKIFDKISDKFQAKFVDFLKIKAKQLRNKKES